MKMAFPKSQISEWLVMMVERPQRNSPRAPIAYSVFQFQPDVRERMLSQQRDDLGKSMMTPNFMDDARQLYQGNPQCFEMSMLCAMKIHEESRTRAIIVWILEPRRISERAVVLASTSKL